MPIGTENTVVPGCGLHHIALQTRNLDESLRLYRDVLGMKPVLEFGSPDRKIVLVDMGDGSHLELFGPKPGQPSAAQDPNHPLVHIALATSDTRKSIEIARQAGYEVTVEPKDVTLSTCQATIAFFRGPSGEVIEFFQVR